MTKHRYYETLSGEYCLEYLNEVNGLWTTIKYFSSKESLEYYIENLKAIALKQKKEAELKLATMKFFEL